MDFSPILISLKTGAVSIFFTFFLGLFAAWLVVSRKSETTKVVLDGLFTMPLVLPPTVAGFFLLLVFGANGPVGKLALSVFGFKIAFSWVATVLAAIVISFPLMYRTTRGALEQVDRDMIDAGRTLGMSEAAIFFRVMVPNASAGIVSAAILSFARGLGEFGATAMIAGNIPGRTRTLPLAVYSKAAGGDLAGAGVYVLIILGICLAAVVVMNLYQIKVKKERSDR